MRVLFLSNTRSGRGLSRWATRIFPATLRQAGHEVTEAAVGDPHGSLRDRLSSADALVLAGGDGTVHRAAGDAIHAGVPVYHVPCGNENLFARQFGMDRKVETLLKALAHRNVAHIDVARVSPGDRAPVPGPATPLAGNGSTTNGADDLDTPLSLLMISVGPDAGVIHRLTALRTRAIGHLAYVEPVVRECLSPTFPRLTVEVDGRRILDHARGTLIIANSRQYALRIDPARRADMTDGLLDVVFLPGGNAFKMAAWLAACRLRRDIERSGAIYVTGRDVTISSREAAPYQIDGDSPGWQGAEVGTTGNGRCHPLSLRISVWPGVLPILVPPEA